MPKAVPIGPLNVTVEARKRPIGIYKERKKTKPHTFFACMYFVITVPRPARRVTSLSPFIFSATRNAVFIFPRVQALHV